MCSHTIEREERGVAAPLRREREVQPHHWKEKKAAVAPLERKGEVAGLVVNKTLVLEEMRVLTQPHH